MRTWVLVLGVASLSAPGALAQESTSLTLSCVGTDATVLTLTPYAWGYRGSAYAGGVAFGEGRAPAQLGVAVDGAKVRVRPPKSSVPLFAKDSADGWYELTDVTVDKFAIRGRLKFNRLDRVKLDVDRRTGQATFGAFTGACQPVSTSPDATKF